MEAIKIGFQNDAKKLLKLSKTNSTSGKGIVHGTYFNIGRFYFITAFFCQNKRLPADLDLRDDNDDNGNSSPRSVKETEPAWRFEETLESVRDEGLIPDRIEEPLRTYATKAREDSLQEQDIEDIPLDEPIKEEVADVLGDNGVPLDDLINEKQDGSVDGMYM